MTALEEAIHRWKKQSKYVEDIRPEEASESQLALEEGRRSRPGEATVERWWELEAGRPLTQMARSRP